MGSVSLEPWFWFVDLFCFRVWSLAVCVVCLQLTVPKEADASQTVGFRSLLLNKCQQEFEKDKVEELDIAERQKLIDEATSVSVYLSLCVVSLAG